MNYYKVDRALAFVYNKIFLSSYTQPINVDIEKKKLFKNKTYDPQLKYKKPNVLNLEKFKEMLRKIKTDSSLMGTLLNQKRDELIGEINLIKSVSTPLFTRYSLKLFDKPSTELVNKSFKFLELNSEESSIRFNTISAMKKFLDALLSYGLHWQVREKDMFLGATFNKTERIIYINKNRSFNEDDLKRLIVHEIGTHIIRGENAKKQKYKLFLMGFPYYLPTEEGLAVYNEEKAGLLTNDILKEYAGRVVAVNLALKNSFSTIYNDLLEFFPKEKAWVLAIRAKRGLGDTSKPGGFTKDHIYLKGKYIIEDFVKKGGKVKDLYIGKIGVEHVPLIKKIQQNEFY